MKDENEIKKSAESGGESPQTSTDGSGRSRLFKKLAIAFVVLLLIAIAIMLFASRKQGSRSQAGKLVPAPEGMAESVPGGAEAQPGDLLVNLSAEQLQNAHIQTAVATAPSQEPSSGPAGLRTTGTVQSNAYKEVPVLPVAGGIVRRVSAEAGERVKRGQPLAVVFSNELAEAESTYLGMLAEAERHHQHFRRTVELVEIGAASREELDDATSQNKIEEARLASMREKLTLLGLGKKQIDELGSSGRVDSLLTIESPAAGTILTRTVNAGEVIAAGKELFRVADLSTVWVVGQLYENDIASVRTGTLATITVPAYPQKTFTGRVSFIDPRVEPQTRTAQVRVEVENPHELLRLGMFVDVSFGVRETRAETSQAAAVVPKGAVQLVGAKQVVYLPTNQPGEYIQREIAAGAESGGFVRIYKGLAPGDVVVTDGSFMLRAESSKVNRPQPAASGSGDHDAAEAALSTRSGRQIQSITVVLGESGYEPSVIRLRAGVPAELTFIRKAEVTCGTEVQIPDYRIKRDLPLGEPVLIELTPRKSGEYAFSCGMNMLRGSIVVR